AGEYVVFRLLSLLIGNETLGYARFRSVHNRSSPAEEREPVKSLFPRRNTLFRGIALALLASPSAAALAQDAAATAEAAPQELEAAVVAGVRASPTPAARPPAEAAPRGLAAVVGPAAPPPTARAVAPKRGAGTVRDSITGLERGKSPHDNVADSLSHITGVAISRTAGGEGQKVSVRGLGPEYTLTTFNGRILATDGAGRDFAYDVLPADVISGADVIKGAQASLSEGAIG